MRETVSHFEWLFDDNLQDAVAADQFIGVERTISDGDVDAALAEAEHVLEGESRVGGQEHFYLETQSCLVLPKGEDGEMEIISATQPITFVQKFAAMALGIPQNKIVIKIKRIGKKLYPLLKYVVFINKIGTRTEI